MTLFFLLPYQRLKDVGTAVNVESGFGLFGGLTFPLCLHVKLKRAVC